MAGSRARRFAIAIAGAAAGLAVLASETVDSLQSGDPRAGSDHVRWIAAGACLVAALAARRMSSRVEAKGFVVAAVALAASVLCEHGANAVSSALDRDWSRWLVPVRAAEDLVALGVPVVLGAWWIGIPAGDLLGPSRSPLRDFGVAIAAGLLLYPVLSLATNATLSAVDALRGGQSHPWRGLAHAMRSAPFTDVVADEASLLAVRLGLTLPLIEVLLHGVLRQSFSRWGIVGFAVVTAVFAPLLFLQQGVSFFLFGGALVTGIVAARGGSVLPGFAFWMALFAGVALWLEVLPKG